MDPQFQSKGFGFATFRTKNCFSSIFLSFFVILCISVETESMMRSAMTKLSKNRIRNRRLKVDIARPLGTEGTLFLCLLSRVL